MISRNTLRPATQLALAAAVLAAGPNTPAAADTLDLSAYKGKVVYLDFWASWCQPCKQSFPYMERLKSQFGDQGLVILAVNVDHSRPRADAFLQEQGSDLQIVYDPDGALARQNQVSDMPTSILIGRDGKAHYVHKGFHPEQIAEYDSQLRELLHDH